MSHLLKILILLLSLLLSFSVETHSRKKKNKYVLKRTKSVELLQIEPDPVAYEAVPDRESLGLLLPDIFFSMSHTSYIHGFDMSHHQGDVDWKEVAKDPNAGYIFLKATEGANFVDRKYKHNFREAKKAGLKVGSYHFFRPNVSGEEQYNLFISNIDYKAQDLIPIIDVEIHPSRRLSLSTFYKRLDTLLELVTKK